ncbi:hypothetical protein CBS101457_002599 [Exobasidium rhododendri]|nr:hypothetical protein CBS101457_002599 [Exobasidium rhododendri]
MPPRLTSGGDDVIGESSQAPTQEDVARHHREKRALRQDYRKLIGKTENVRSNLADHTPVQLSQMIKTGTEMYERVKEPTEGVLDSKFLLNASDLGTHFARNMKVNTGFAIEDYLKRCATMLGGTLLAPGRAAAQTFEDEEEEGDADDWDWESMGRQAAKRTKRASTLDFLLGPLAVEHKKRVIGKRAPMDKSGPIVKPQELNHDDIVKSENETTKMVKSIYQILQAVGGPEGVNFFKFVLDPTSFANSVENIFYVSFLVRDGMVSLEDVEGNPTLTSVEKPTEEDYQQGLKKQQLVMEFDMVTWRDLLDVYSIRKPTIPSRSAQANGDTWTR